MGFSRDRTRRGQTEKPKIVTQKIVHTLIFLVVKDLMLHTCAARFDVTGNLEKFWVFLVN